MAAIDFPNAPSNGDAFVAAGKTWVYVSSTATWTLRSNPTAIPDGGITTAMLVDGSVTAAKIADGTIVAAEIASDSITTVKILDSAVTTGKIAAGAVTAAKLDTVYAPVASPTLTGIPAAPTASAATSTTQIATTAFVTDAVSTASAIAASAASAQIGEDIINAKGDLITGTANDAPAILSVGTNGFYLKADSSAATGLAWADLSVKANLASPTFTGVPAAPTAALGTNTTQVATTAFVSAAISTMSINAQTGTTYTLALTDAGMFLTQSNASAIATTIPANSSVAFPTGTQITIMQLGAGQVTLTPGAGVTLSSSGAKLKINGQYAVATVVKIATDNWVCIGNLAT